MKIGVKVRNTFKNHEFYKARIERGYHVFADFVKAFNCRYETNISYNTLMRWENMKGIPGVRAASLISDFLGIEPEILFPRNSVKNIVKTIKKINKDMYFVGEAEYLLSYSWLGESNITSNINKENIKDALSILTDKERKVIEIRFYNNYTYEEAGKQLNVTRERVRQIESRAMRKIRFNKRSRNILYETLTDIASNKNDLFILK